MAPITAELATLRALTFRISSTSTSQLPQHVSAISASLANCRLLLSSSQATGPKSSSEASVAVHKYRTLLSTLLQDRTIQGRWAAIVLIKATIEIGGWETLQKSLPWVRGLLGILTKPDPTSSKKLCIITLTRIFILTREYPTLVREITTPSLPAFIQSNLQVASSGPSASLFQTILESFNQLLPRHPTIFRSYLKQLQQLLGQTIAPTPSSRLGSEQLSKKLDTTSNVSAAARQLYTQLSCCAPKGAASEEWQSSFRKTVQTAQRTSDQIFRAVVEDWKPSTYDTPVANGHTLDDEPQDTAINGMALPPWSGIFAGGERLVSLLKLLKDYLECPTAGPVSLQIGVAEDLLMRLLSLTVPSSSASKSFQNNLRFNNQVSKEERENLWLILPDVHVAAVDVILALTRRCDVTTAAIDMTMLDQVVWVFGSEKAFPQIRTACYLAIAQILKRSGIALPKSSVESLGLILRTCCDDILPLDHSNDSATQIAQRGNTKGNAQQALTNADSFLESSKGIKDSAATFKGVQEAAFALLPMTFTAISRHLSDSLRNRLDRTAILVRHNDAMAASVLNPPFSRQSGKPAASILPLLTRSNAGGQVVEALLKPRMPVVRNSGHDPDGDGEEDADEEDDEEDIDSVEEDEHFIGHELDALLEIGGNTDSAPGDVDMVEAADFKVPSEAKSTRDMPAIDDTTISNRDVSDDIEQSRSGGKRPQDHDLPLSPTKRVKTDDETSHVAAPFTSTPAPAPTPFATSAPLTPETTLLVSTAPSTSQASVPFRAVTPTPAETPADGGSDDEDIVSLVLGQDTDEESE